MKTTLVSMLFDISKLENNQSRRRFDDYKKTSGLVLNAALPLHFFGDQESVDFTAKRRTMLGLGGITRCEVVDILNSKYSHDLALTESSEALGWSKSKDTPLYAAVTMFKFDALERARVENEFASQSLLWIDYGIQYVADVVPMNDIVSRVGRQVRVQIMNYTSRAEVANRREFYAHRRPKVCGGLFGGSCGAVKLLKQFFDLEYQKFIKCGCYGTDESILSVVAAEHPDLFEFYAGDYKSILTNFSGQRNEADRISQCIEGAVRDGNVEVARMLGATSVVATKQSRVIITGISPEISSACGDLNENKRLYACAVGAKYIVGDGSFGIPLPTYQKIYLISRCLETFDVVAWCDMDVAFTNFTKDIFSILPDGFDIGALAGASGEMNAGMIIVRKTDASILFFKKLIETIESASDGDLNTHPYDQTFFNRLALQECVNVRRMSADEIGACEAHGSRAWMRGDIAVHIAIADRRWESRNELFVKKYKDSIVTKNFDSTPRIVLATMVKNESRVIGRMIRSALPYIDAALICDTGSDDDTRVRAAAECRSVHCETEFVEWSDFATNRTKTIELAKAMISRLGWSLDQTWILLLDADQELKPISPSFSKLDLTGHDIIQLQQASAGEDWMTPRSVRASLECRYVRRTHEYLDHKSSDIADATSAILIEHSDGGSRADKFIRDERLLRMDLADNPNDERSMFYLARTLRDLGRMSEAREWYRKRVDAGGFPEECWVAQLHLGRCYLSEGSVACGRENLWKAFLMRPWRAEPLLDLAKSHMDAYEHWTACRIADLGLSMPYPEKDVLFIERPAYQWGFNRILAICCSWIGERKSGLINANKLRLYPGCPHHHEAMDLLPWYAPKLEAEWTRDVPFVAEDGWHPCNPSIIKTDSGYAMTVRTVNYKINASGGYYDFGSAVMTRNFLIEMDHDLKPVLTVELKSIRMNETHNIRGVEDIRPYRVTPDCIFGLCTRADGKLLIPRVYEAQWLRVSGLCLRQNEMMHTESACEKNWLPWVVDGKNMALYSHSPFTTFSFQGTEISNVLSRTGTEFDFSGFSGSAAPVAWRGGWLYVVHECTRPSDKKRTYLHRFCWMSSDLVLKSVSAPFYFERTGIEYCSGMAPHGDGVVLTYGLDDHEARMSYVLGSTISRMLELRN